MNILNVTSFHLIIVQIAIFFLVSAIAGFLIFLRFHRFNNKNPQPAIRPIYPVLHKEEIKGPPLVQCGLYINEFSDFSIITSQFTADVFIWFIFNPSQIDKNIVENFTIEKAEILHKEKREIKFIGNKLFTQYKARVKFTSTLFFNDFPFDDHRLYLTLINDNLSPDELRFQGSEQALRFNPELNLSGWKLINVGVKTGYRSALLDTRNDELISYPCITFSLDFKRKGIRQALIVILPMLGMFFIAYTSLTFNTSILAQKLSIVSISMGSIMGLLAYRFVLENITPKVGYFTLTDHMFFIFLTSSFTVFLFKLYLALSTYSFETNSKLNSISVIVIPVLFLCMFLALFNYKKLSRDKK